MRSPIRALAVLAAALIPLTALTVAPAHADDPVTVNVADAAVAEGNAGQHKTLHFTVTLSAPLATSLKVYFSTADGTATVADNDYTPKTSSTTVTAGATSKDVTVSTVGDNTFETDETVSLTLTSTNHPELTTIDDGTADGTISNDEAGPGVLTISGLNGDGDLVKPEGNPGDFYIAHVFFQLDAPQPFDVKVTYTTVDGTATAPGDYTAKSGTITIPAGHTADPFTDTVIRQVLVPITADSLPEGPETFQFTLTGVNSTGIVLGPDKTITIIDED